MEAVYKDDLHLVYRVEVELISILRGDVLPVDRVMLLLSFSYQSCGETSRGGPEDAPPCEGLPFKTIVREMRRSALAALGDWHIRFRLYYESCPLELASMVVPPRVRA